MATSQQNSTTHPEFGPRNPAREAASGEVATGTIVFSQHPSSPGDPMDTIRRAIAGGDTTEKRTEQFREAIFSVQK